MTTSETEYTALSNMAKADGRFRVVQYAIAFAFLVVAFWLAYVINSAAQHVIDVVENGVKEIKVLNDETRQYNTCLLLVPIGERSPEKQRECFREIDQPGGLDEKIFQTSPPTRDGASVTAPNEVPNQSLNSSSNDTLPAKEEQRETSQEPQTPVNPSPKPDEEPESLTGIPIIDSVLKALGGN